MKEQSYANHTRFHPLQHFVWLPLSFLLLVTTVIYGVYEFVKHGFSLQLLLLVGIVILAIIPGILARVNSLTLQDRLICTEEQLRYYMITGKRLDDSVTKDQLIALRFAPDAELVELVHRSIDEKLSSADIKKSIKIWRADHQRV